MAFPVKDSGGIRLTGSFLDRNHAACATIIVLLALFLRLHGLDREGFFVDELRQSLSYGLSLRELIAVAAKQNLPPFDYWLGHIVSRISQADFALRLPAALFGTATVALLMLTVRSHFSAGASLFTGAFLSLLPFHLHYSQQLRPYSSAMFLCALTLAMFDRFFRKRPRIGFFIGAYFTFTLFLLTRPEGPIIFLLLFFAIACTLLLRRGKYLLENTRPSRENVLLLATAVGLAVASFWPILRQIIDFSPQIVPTGSLAAINSPAHAGGLSLNALWPVFCVQMDPLGPLLLPVVLAGSFMALTREKYSRNIFLVSCGASVLVIPVAHLLLWQLRVKTEPQPGYFFYLVLLSLVMLAVFVDTVSDLATTGSSSRARRLLLLVPSLCLVALAPFTFLYKSTPHNEDWAGLCRHLEASLPARSVLVFDDVVPLGGYEHSFWGFPRYFGPNWTFLGENPSKTEDELQPPSDYRSSPVFDNMLFRLFYAFKGFPFLDFLPPDFIYSPPGRPRAFNFTSLKLFPEIYQQFAWQSQASRGGGPKFTHLSLIPFLPLEKDPSREPVFILYYHQEKVFSAASRHPYRYTPYTREPSLKTLQQNPKLRIASFKEFAVVRLANPSFDLKRDALLLSLAILPAMPPDSSRIDLLLAMTWLEKDLGVESWRDRILQVLTVAEKDGISVAQMDELASFYYKSPAP